MLRFQAFIDGKPLTELDLASAYLVGSEHVPLRAEISLKKGMILCDKRTGGPAALALLWPVDGMGRILLETTRLQERDTPYVLTLELLRGQLMRLNQKREEWGLYDAPEIQTVNDHLDQACELLIDALKADTPVEAANIGDRALAITVPAGEALSRFHASILLERRIQTAGFTRRVFGCHVNLEDPAELSGKFLADAVDFVTIPIDWRQIEPTEQKFNFKPIDTWVEWLTKQQIPMKGSALVSIREGRVPDWLYIWEHDFDTIRELVTEHIKRVVNRYNAYIQVWDVISGIHAIEEFSFSFEQLIELTRLAVNVTKQVAPRSIAIIDLVAPWGEYYARNQRTIPPMLYMEMAMQSGINFDACGLQFYFGVGRDGMYVRDMFQISSIIERFGGFGKPIHITAVQVPSDTAVDKKDAWGGSLSVKDGGTWHEDWSEAIQARWLREFCEIALSKPYVDSITYRDLSDRSPHQMPNGGLLRADMTPKQAYNDFVALRKRVGPGAAKG